MASARSVFRNSWFQLFALSGVMAAGLTAYNVAQTKTATADNAAHPPTTPSVPANQGPSLSPPAPITSEAYRLAAEKGDAKAQYNLGLLYEFGTGVAKDVVQASQWYAKAAEQGYAEAQFRLGLFYEFYSVPIDFVEAARWYRKGAEQNYAEAQLNLGNLYFRGDGVTKDPAEVLKWWAKAAAQGDAQAQYSFGTLYENGAGVPRNLTEAKNWYSKSAAQGLGIATSGLKRLRERSTQP